MGFFDQLKQKTQEMSSQLQHEAAKFKSKEFAKASMAICAMISAADGSIDASERQKTAALIMANPTLQMFDATALRADFDHYCNALTADFDFGKIEAVQALSKLKSKPDQARAVIQIGIIIGGADGNFDSDEKQVVREACFAVGINPAEFDLG